MKNPSRREYHYDPRWEDAEWEDRDDSFPGPKPLKLSADAPCRSCVWRDAEGCCCLMFLMWFGPGWKEFQRVILPALKEQGRDIPIVLKRGGKHD